MQGFVMGWKLFHQIYAEITIWKRYLVGNSEASSFGSKIEALNFRKLLNYVKDLGYYAQNPVIV